jgi:hypothetical protein
VNVTGSSCTIGGVFELTAAALLPASEAWTVPMGHTLVIAESGELDVAGYLQVRPRSSLGKGWGQALNDADGLDAGRWESWWVKRGRIPACAISTVVTGWERATS